MEREIEIYINIDGERNFGFKKCGVVKIRKTGRLVSKQVGSLIFRDFGYGIICSLILLLDLLNRGKVKFI